MPKAAPLNELQDLWELMEAENDRRKTKHQRSAPEAAEDDMWFSGTTVRSGVYTVVPKDFQTFPDGRRMPGTTRGLEARFKNHAWNAQSAAEANNWSNTEKELVKAYLRQHPDYNVRIYDRPIASAMGAAHPDQFCVFVRVVAGKPEQCGKQAMSGSQFCEDCAQIAKRLPQESKIAEPIGA